MGFFSCNTRMAFFAIRVLHIFCWSINSGCNNVRMKQNFSACYQNNTFEYKTFSVKCHLKLSKASH